MRELRVLEIGSFSYLSLLRTSEEHADLRRIHTLYTLIIVKNVYEF